MNTEHEGMILILEDDPGVAKLERLRLERAGYAVEVAETAEQAIEIIRRGGIDLMVLDYRLDGPSNGLDVHRRVRTAGFDLPSILVTGFGDERILAEALRAGVRDFIPKTPTYLELLAPTVARIMAQVRLEKQLTARQRQLEIVRHRSNQLQRLAAVSSTLNAALEVDGVVKILAEESRVLIGADRAIANLILSDDRTIAVQSLAGDAVKPVAAPVVELEGPSGEALLHNRPVRATPPDRAAGTLLAAPLVARDGRNLGLVQLFDKPEGPFTDDDEAILVQLAQMASVAVENARLYQELRETDANKTNFISMLAHELRNPLAAIDGAIRTYGLTEHPQDRAWAEGVIRRQSKQLSRLVDDLLDVSRINRGKILLRTEVVDLIPIALGAVDAVLAKAESCPHEINLDLPSTPLWVDGDPTRLEQIFVNLLANAIKYTPKRGLITLKTEHIGDEILIEIKDNGEGIASDILPHVFEPFTQADRTIDRAQGGLGIGLSLVRRLVEQHKGTVTAESGGLGRGSLFRVRLPAVSPPKSTEAVPEPSVGDPSGSIERILIVDDNMDSAQALEMLLSNPGRKVRAVFDGHAGMAAFREFRPNAILLDIGLPGLNGYEVARLVRTEPTGSPVILIAISGYNQEEDRIRSKAAGFDYHLGKPVDFDVLFSILNA